MEACGSKGKLFLQSSLVSGPNLVKQYHSYPVTQLSVRMWLNTGKVMIKVSSELWLNIRPGFEATVQQTPTKISSSVTPGGKQRERIDPLEFQKDVLSQTPGEIKLRGFYLGK